MVISDANIMGGMHLVILGAGASIASCLRNPELHGKKLPSMNGLSDVIDMSDILSQVPQNLLCCNFEELYGNIYEWDNSSPLLKEINQRIYTYFRELELPLEPTIYDYLIMSLREKDVIATFNWDPFLYQAWWRNYYHGSSPQLIFLHGNVAIGYNEENNGIGWAGTIGKIHKKYYIPTQLMFPIKHKNYKEDRFIIREWSKLNYCLKKAQKVTIFGYSAPKSDVEAISTMQSAWGSPLKRNMEQFEFIDIRSELDIIDSWSSFIHSHHYDFCTDFFESSLAQYPRRTFEAHMLQTLPITPEEAFVEPLPIPHKEIHSFEKMWAWYEPLIAKE